MASVISAGLTSGTSLNLTGDTSGQLQFQTNGTTAAMTIDTSQNVGIGTSSPVSSLTVNGNANLASGGFLAFSASAPSASNFSLFGNGSTTVLNGPSAGVLQFNIANSEKMRLDSSGNLGLGVTPSAWGSNFKVLQVGSQDPAIMIGRTDGPSWAAWGVNFYNDNSNWRYINSDYASFYNIYADGHYWYSAPSGSAGATFSPTQVLNVIKDQSLALQGASSQTGTGITFPATQSASSNANTLDDYEEGTWTPTLTFGGGSTGQTYGTRAGSYTKIGRVVYATCRITLINKGSSTGSAKIEGLPFTALSGNTGYAAGSFAYIDLVPNGTRWSAMQIPVIDAGSSYIFLRYFNGTQASDQTETSFNNNSDMIIAVTYQV